MSGIVIDSNLLLLLVVGFTDRGLIEKHKRTREFVPGDYELLLRILEPYKEVHVTPHIVTEVSNLVSQIGEPNKTKLLACLGRLIPAYSESFLLSKELVYHRKFDKLGLTDCAILELVGTEMHLVTVDLELYLTALKGNPNVYNFNHVRQSNLLDI